MNNNRRRTSHSKRRALIIRRRIAVAVALLLVALIVVILIITTKGSDDSVAPIIKPVASATAEITVEPTLEATEEPIAEATEIAVQATQEVITTVAPVSDGAGLRSVHFRIIGDVMFHEEQLKIAKQSDGSYDFHSQFKYIADSLAAADYTMANLETTVGKYNDMGYSGYPQFNTPESVLVTLKDAGIDFFTMANNHMLDRWFDGMKNDVNLVEEYGFDHVGAYRTKEERNTPVLYDINGIRFGFVAYTHTTNTMENYCDKDVFEYAVPYLYKADIESDVAALKNAGAEVIVAFPHWGTENTYIPDETQQKYAKKLAKVGVDIIIGSHSHMVEPMKVVTGTDAQGNEKQVFLIYSMGNFISAMSMERTDNGIILDLTVEEQADGSFKVMNVGYVPLYVWKQNKQLFVVPILKYKDNRPEGMNNEQYARMMASYDEITGVLGTNYNILSE